MIAREDSEIREIYISCFEWLEHHLYVCSEESEELKRHLLFRNLLLDNPDLVIKYELLKKRLATEHKHNRAAYVDGKTDFVEQVLKDFCIIKN